MPYMEDFTAKPSPTAVAHVDVTRYGLGAQGIDLISAQRVQGPEGDPLMNPATLGTVDPLYPNDPLQAPDSPQNRYSTQRVSFPVYDGHGNMICTVARNTGTVGYSVQNVKRYDVWGGVRSDSGASSSASGGHLANTDKRYCANLGHASDIETGLIYMCARYYEPTTGRFLSEDPARDGRNWFVYADNGPKVNYDFDGRFTLPGILNDLSSEIESQVNEIAIKRVWVTVLWPLSWALLLAMPNATGMRSVTTLH